MRTHVVIRIKSKSNIYEGLDEYIDFWIREMSQIINHFVIEDQFTGS